MGLSTLNEMKHILTQEKCKDSECVSLYDILKLISDEHRNYDIAKRPFERYLTGRMDAYNYQRENFSEEELERIRLLYKGYGAGYTHSDYFDVRNFDFNKEKLEVGLKSHTATFVKVNGDLVMNTKSDFVFTGLLATCGQGISNYFDHCLKYKPLFTQTSDNIKSINSNFIININHRGLSVSTSIEHNENEYNFILLANVQNNKYDYCCNSFEIIDTFRYNEDEIFKRIFIRIDDCPKWTQTPLYEIRKSQLKKEFKQEKRLELKRKLFPFLKK